MAQTAQVPQQIYKIVTSKIFDFAILSFMLFMFFIAFFTYEQNWVAAVGFLMWEFVFALIVLLSLIPFAGWLFFLFFNLLWSSGLMDFFTIYPTWLTNFVFVIYLLIAIFLEAIMTLVALGLSKGWTFR